MKKIYSLGFAPNLNLHTNDNWEINSAAQSGDSFSYSLKTYSQAYSLSTLAGEMVLSPSRARTKPKTHSWKRRLFAFAAVIVLGVATGVGLGNWYKDYIASQSFDYSALAIADYEIDSLTVINSATGLSYTSLEQYGTYGNIASILHSQGKSPASLSAVQNVALAEFVSTTAYSYTASGSGLVDTIVKQPFSCKKTFDGNQYVVESISSGAVMGHRLDVGNRCVTLVSEPNTTYVYPMISGTIPVADENGLFEGKFEQTPKKYSYDEFIELNGLPTNRMVPYIVSDKTVLDGTTSATKTNLDGKDVYQFTLVLDPVGSVLRYWRQMNFTSGYNPKFSSVSVTVTIDENWNFVRTEVLEKYTIVAMGVPAGCTGTMTTNYVYNENNAEVNR